MEVSRLIPNCLFGCLCSVANTSLVCYFSPQGRWVYLDGQKNGIFTKHSLALCYLFGPIGVLSHLLTRTLFSVVKPGVADIMTVCVWVLEYVGTDLINLQRFPLRLSGRLRRHSSFLRARCCKLSQWPESSCTIPT